MYTHTHTQIIYAGWGFFSAGSVKNRRGAFVLLKIHLIMSVAGSLPELVGFKKTKKEKEKQNSQSPVPSSVLHTLHTQHSGPDFLQSPSETAPLFGENRLGR